MANHRVYVETLEGDSIVVSGDEAHHAVRVKRLEIGDELTAFDGRGGVVHGKVEAISKAPRTGEWSLRMSAASRNVMPRVVPHIEVWSAVPKGGRATEMIEGLSEVGAASWAPLEAARSVVESGEHKLSKLSRAALESSKQCGREWMLEIGTGGDLRAALQGAPSNGVCIVCDGSGAPAGGPVPAWARLLVGPEGGWTSEELERMRAAGAQVMSFGPHIMRLETAAVIAAGTLIVMARRGQAR